MQGSNLLARKRNLRGRKASRASALGSGLDSLKQALATELKAAAVAGLSAPGAGVDSHRHGVLVHRVPSGEIKIVRRLKPFRWTSKVLDEA